MLRAGASLPAVKELLGHKTITMTLRYVEVNQVDLQREYHRARQEMRFPAIPQINKTRKNPVIPTLLHILGEARHQMEMFRRQLPREEMRRKLARLTNRLDKISAEMSEFDKAEK